MYYLIPDLGFRFNFGRDWDEGIFAVDLDTMFGVINQSYALLIEMAAEFADGPFPMFLIRIDQQDESEVQLLQGLGYILRGMLGVHE